METGADQITERISKFEASYHFLGALASHPPALTLKGVVEMMPVRITQLLRSQYVAHYHPTGTWRDEFANQLFAQGLVENYPEDNRKIQMTPLGRKIHDAHRENLRARMSGCIILSEE